jgi:hypothetical protein
MSKDTTLVNDVEVRNEGVIPMRDGTVGVVVHHIVGEDGLSDKERNLKNQHTIPLFSLVEIEYEGSEEFGLRLYVQGHSRDCDGTPLYNLTHDYRVVGKDVSTDRMRNAKDRFEHMLAVMDTGKITGGYSADSLVVVRTADEVKNRLIEHGYMDANGKLI